jgi:helix-turn-helix protein
MSNARFSIVQARAVKDQRVSNAQFRTLSALGMYSDKDGWCYPSQSTIGEDIGKSRQTVNGDIQALAELGYVEIRHDTRPDGGWTSNMYRLVFDPPVSSLADTPLSNLSDTNDPLLTPQDSNTASEEKPPSSAPETFPVEWQIATGNKTIVVPDSKESQYQDAAWFISKGTGSLEKIIHDIAYTFMIKRAIMLSYDDANGHRKAARKMAKQGVLPQHVEEAIIYMANKNMTCVDLWSIEKIAISLANPILINDYSTPQPSKFTSMDESEEE